MVPDNANQHLRGCLARRRLSGKSTQTAVPVVYPLKLRFEWVSAFGCALFPNSSLQSLETAVWEHASVG